MDENNPKRRRSTNPFDDSSSDEESAANDVFHDCHDVLLKKREAKLDFSFHSDPVAGKISCFSDSKTWSTNLSAGDTNVLPFIASPGYTQKNLHYGLIV